jgi:hypothetical protein
MFIIFKKMFSLSFLFILFLLLMVSCGAEGYLDIGDDSESSPVSAEIESAAQPSDDGLKNSPSIDDTCILWKPISEGDHNLVILLPTNYGSPDVFILDDAGNYVEHGRYVGRTNGDRATYRFSRPGHGYSHTSYVQVGGTIYKVVGSNLRHSC